jgi:hypothetical protein
MARKTDIIASRRRGCGDLLDDRRYGTNKLGEAMFSVSVASKDRWRSNKVMEIGLWQSQGWAGCSQVAGAGFGSEVGDRADSLCRE